MEKRQTGLPIIAISQIVHVAFLQGFMSQTALWATLTFVIVLIIKDSENGAKTADCLLKLEACFSEELFMLNGMPS